MRWQKAPFSAWMRSTELSKKSSVTHLHEYYTIIVNETQSPKKGGGRKGLMGHALVYVVQVTGALDLCKAKSETKSIKQSWHTLNLSLGFNMLLNKTTGDVKMTHSTLLYYLWFLSTWVTSCHTTGSSVIVLTAVRNKEKMNESPFFIPVVFW